MSTSPVFISLKLAMKAKIKEDTKLKKDTVTNLCRDIYHMQTLSEAMLFIDLNDLVIDTTNLQEDFDAEQRAAATSSLLPSMDPAEIASKGRLDEKTVADLRVISWDVPASKTDMKFPFSLRYSVGELGQLDYDAYAHRENQNLRLQDTSTVEMHRPQLLSSDLAAMREFLTALADYYDQGGLRPFRALISKAAMKAIAPKLGRQLASIDDRELLFLLRTMCGAKSAAEPFPYKSALKQAYMTNADWSPTALDVYLG
jgi:hypothetical protein